MINMAFMPLYMWKMWDVTPVHTPTHRQLKVEQYSVWAESAISTHPPFQSWERDFSWSLGLSPLYWSINIKTFLLHTFKLINKNQSNVASHLRAEYQVGVRHFHQRFCFSVWLIRTNWLIRKISPWFCFSLHITHIQPSSVRSIAVLNFPFVFLPFLSFRLPLIILLLLRGQGGPKLSQHLQVDEFNVCSSCFLSWNDEKEETVVQKIKECLVELEPLYARVLCLHQRFHLPGEDQVHLWTNFGECVKDKSTPLAGRTS